MDYPSEKAYMVTVLSTTIICFKVWQFCLKIIFIGDQFYDRI